MINILVENEVKGVKKYAIAKCTIVRKDTDDRLSEVQRNLSSSDNTISLQILSEALGKPANFNYIPGNMSLVNHILLTHFFDKYRLRSDTKYINIIDQAIINDFTHSFSNEYEFAELCSKFSDLLTFSESILPYIDFDKQIITNWMPEHILSRVGIAYNDAKTNTDLLNLSMEILKRRQNNNFHNIGNIR